MNKIFLLACFLLSFSFAHPVSYTINLDVSYDNSSKKVKVICKSNSKNKCGLYNYHLVDANNNIMKTKRYPFLKNQSTVTIDNKPQKLIFFLRKVPEHTYIKIFE